jgi:ADP-ribosylglycohydrolase
MSYPKLPDYQGMANQIAEYSRLKHEYGAKGIEEILQKLEKEVKASLEELKALPIDEELAKIEPNDFDAIKALRPQGPRKMWDSFKEDEYREKLAGALIARMAGCTLGAPVEFIDVEVMENWAKYNGDAYPPLDYWKKTFRPYVFRYRKSDFISYTKEAMTQVPADDDIAYTLLGLLMAEDHGIDFTTEEAGKAWLKYLPFACTAEDIALKNMRAGVPAKKAAEIDNPYCEWIGADIRSDPFAYMAPAYPEKAAAMAYQDAYLSHRRNGIYGEMFFSAVQSAAFAVDNPVDAIQIGLTEIPQDCSLAKAVAWALEEGKSIRNYKQARAAVDEHFKGMSGVHTNNNACLTIFGLMIGQTSVTKVISETVAMGLDNDCTAATAGSIVGAIAGIKNVPEHWYKPFNNTVVTYLIGNEEFKIDDLLRRFEIQARKAYAK